MQVTPNNLFCVDALILGDDSDSSSSPSTSYTTPASVAAFVKKVKRIRFNSITIAKDLPTTGRLLVPRPTLLRATSCPDVLAPATDIGTPSSVSSSQHHLVIASPATSLRSPFGNVCLASPLAVDRISVATQTTMYIHGSESDVVTHLAPYESLVAQTIPFAPFIQCYACLHGRQPVDETKIRNGMSWIFPPFPLSLFHSTFCLLSLYVFGFSLRRELKTVTHISFVNHLFISFFVNFFFGSYSKLIFSFSPVAAFYSLLYPSRKQNGTSLQNYQ